MCILKPGYVKTDSSKSLNQDILSMFFKRYLFSTKRSITVNGKPTCISATSFESFVRFGIFLTDSKIGQMYDKHLTCSMYLFAFLLVACPIYL